MASVECMKVTTIVQCTPSVECNNHCTPSMECMKVTTYHQSVTSSMLYKHCHSHSVKQSYQHKVDMAQCSKHDQDTTNRCLCLAFSFGKLTLRHVTLVTDQERNQERKIDPCTSCLTRAEYQTAFYQSPDGRITTLGISLFTEPWSTRGNLIW